MTSHHGSWPNGANSVDATTDDTITGHLLH